MNIETIKRRLLVKYPFFGSVVASSNFISEPAVGTAGTDGKNIYYNPNFIESITDEQKIFIFAHEICHIAFNHIFRSENKDKKIWNIATDSVINAFLKQDDLPMVEGGVDIPQAINYDAEEMYKKLLEEKQQQSSNQQTDSNQNNENSSSLNNGNFDNQNQGEPQDSSHQDSQNNNTQNNNRKGQNNSVTSSEYNSQEQGKTENNDVGHDTHSMWAKAIEKRHKEEQEKQSNEIQNKEKDNKKDEDIKKITKLGEKEVFKQNKIERKKQLEELRKALAGKSHGYGSTTNSERISITDIGTSEPLVDWRKLLKEAVKYDIDWSYQNAEVENGVVTPYLEEIPRPETEIVLDTSDSINKTLLRNFLRECKNILQTSKVKVGCFDTKFYGFTEIKDVSDIDNLSFYGGGGTNFNAAVNAFTKRVENKIIFTDGDASMPSTPIDAIWIVFGNKKIKPVGGKVIYINGEQLARLYNYEMIDERKGKLR